MQPQHVETHRLDGEDIRLKRLIRRCSILAVGPPRLVECAGKETRFAVEERLWCGLVAHGLAPACALCGRRVMIDWCARNVEATLLIDGLHLGRAEIIRLLLEPTVLRAAAVRIDVGEAALLYTAMRFACRTVSHLRDVHIRTTQVDTR